MKEIRWHGRGGNGAFTAAKLLGVAASVWEGKYAQAFPSFGPERRGAPVVGFTRISEEVITDHSQVYDCDCVIVLDETLCDVVDVTAGIKGEGILIINTKKTEDQWRTRGGFEKLHQILTIDATEIALDILGAPIVNTVLLGAGAAASGIVKIESVEQAIETLMSKNLHEKNKVAARCAYDKVRGACKNE